MAVPKKRVSKKKKRIRKTLWKIKANKIALKAFSLAQSILTGRSRSFYYLLNEKSTE
uniref:ribosomal protein L32 n=1 Tax=Equisetum pratense TaxID=231681 RepID=UPI0030FE0EA9